MSKGELLGRMACPSCLMADAMRVTEDKNGHPFGFCDANCGQQLRVGPDNFRIQKFLAAHPGMRPRQINAPPEIAGGAVTGTPSKEGLPATVSKPVEVLTPKKLGFSLGALK